MCVVLPERSDVAVCNECKEHYCNECIDTHTCGTNVMMQLYCSRYLNNASSLLLEIDAVVLS